MKRGVLYGLVMLAVFAAATSTVYAQTQGDFSRTLNISGTPDVEVVTGSGSITIRNGSGNRVEVRGRIRAGFSSWWPWGRVPEDAVRRIESNPPIEQSGQSIRIGRINDRDLQNVSISYEVILPSQSNVRSNSGSGSLTIEGINGSVNARTGSGSITLRDIRGDLYANTGSGSIRASRISGALRMQTGSGGISVEGEQTARWELQTGSGGITIDLPASAGFDLNARSGSGGIDVDFPVTVQGSIRRDRHNVTGKVGNGRYPLEARAGSGSIRIQ